ncbi:DUF1707 domain-containing protein [Brevibacterium sp. GP-SGM9]|uniref:DUF1707 SHOCT-like domain-containing protein n=1 Tax=Brevibacterium sp. GP-SGM9 TaxID=3376990 RepID=UPI0039A4CC29
MNSRPLWSRFSADPRAHAQMRASDADRAVVTDVLSEAYALGQIDAEEFDERIEAAGRLKTLGEVPDLVQDLIVVYVDDQEPSELSSTARAQALARLESDRIPITPEQIEAAAQKYYKDRVRQSLLGLIAGPAGVTIGIWAFSSIVSSQFIFFWPIFIIIPMLLGAISRISHKDEIIRNRRRELTQRARAHLGDAEAQRELEQTQRDGEVDTDGFGHGLQPPHPLEPPYSPGTHSSSRDEMRRRRWERRRRRGNPWD